MPNYEVEIKCAVSGNHTETMTGDNPESIRAQFRLKYAGRIKKMKRLPDEKPAEKKPEKVVEEKPGPVAELKKPPSRKKRKTAKKKKTGGLTTESAAALVKGK